MAVKDIILMGIGAGSGSKYYLPTEGFGDFGGGGGMAVGPPALAGITIIGDFT